MVNTVHTQLSRNSVPRRLQQPEAVTHAMRGRQDNPTPPRARTASPQPAPLNKKMRPSPFPLEITPTQPGRPKKQHTKHTTLHLSPRVRAELERKAQEEGLSVSATGAAILAWYFTQSISTQHGALLETIIDKAIGKHMRAYSNRLAVLLVRNLFAAEQTRSFAYNILCRQPQITEAKIDEIKTRSSNAAKANITRITPQLKTLIETVYTWLDEIEKGGSASE